MTNEILVQGKFTEVTQHDNPALYFTIRFKHDRVLNPTQAVKEIRQEWERVLEKEDVGIVIDVSMIVEPVSMLAGLFHWAWDTAGEHGSTVVFCKPRPSMQKMLKLCGVDSILPVCGSTQEAVLVALGKKVAPNLVTEKKGFFSFLHRS